jgi:ribosomal RNA methyltransferase Nop2
MGHKARNKQADPQPLPGSDAYRDPRNARSAKKQKRKADEAVANGPSKKTKVTVGGVGKKSHKGKGKGRQQEEELSEEEEALQIG